jgi:hypothetical protein
VIDQAPILAPLRVGVRESRRLQPVQQPTRTRDEPPAARRRQSVLGAEVARVLAQCQEDRALGEGVRRERLDPRGAHAIRAYSALQRIAERDYVARVFGVDEFA